MKLRALLLAFLCAACSAGPAQATPLRTDGVAIVGVAVLPMTGQDRLVDQTVLVKGDRIVAVGDRAKVKVPAGYRRVAGTGRTLMPGLVDMHIHLSPEPGRPNDSTQRALALSLAHGVTTARVMLGQPAHPSVRGAIEAGQLAGPRIYIAAAALNDNNTPSPEVARRAVVQAKAAGFDLMKAHSISNVATWDALQDEAKKQGLPVAGHVTNTVGLKRALAVRQQVEHLDSVPAELLPPAASRDFGQFLERPVLDLLARVPQTSFDRLAREVTGSGAYFVPTLAAFERITALQAPFDSMLAEPDASYVADWIIEQWRARRNALSEGGFKPRDSDEMKMVRRRLVKAFHSAGVPIMAGSDTPHPFHVWGFGLVREVQALADAGLGRMDALKAATIVPRDYFRSLPKQGSALGWTADFGTIEPGVRADLLLLDADPSRDLAALRSVRTVIAGGRVYERSDLDAMLRDAAASGKAQPAPGN